MEQAKMLLPKSKNLPKDSLPKKRKSRQYFAESTLIP